HLEAPPHLTRQLPGRLNGSQGTLDLELDVFGHSRAFCGVVYTTTDRLTVLCTRNGLGDLAAHSLIQVGHGLEDVVNAGLDVLEAGRLIRGVTGVTEGRPRQVDRHNKVSRLEVVDDRQQRICKAKDGAGVFASALGDQG